jgi:glycosyltransferase involved in cell wall biosynthesis
MASSVHREAIEAACRADPVLAAINWIFPELSWWRLQACVEPRWERTYNLLWQVLALRIGRRLHRRIGFDAVHHLTWGGLRAPTFLGHVGTPLIIGPIGGGETAPRGLRDAFHFKARITEWLRDFSNQTVRFNPLLRDGLSRAALIYAKTPDTARCLTKAMQARTSCYLELGLDEFSVGQPHAPPAGRMKILFAGRLLYWKGAHIALQAMAEIIRLVPGASLSIVGKGPELGRLQSAAARLSLQNAVEFVPWVARKDLIGLYDAHDLFLFPSLHDSSGGVVLEALARGLPVMCLDCGGPRQIVSPSSGIVIATDRRSTRHLAEAIASEVAALHADPARLSALSAGAIERARAFALPARVAHFYEHAEACLRSNGTTATARAGGRTRPLADPLAQPAAT